ncbi:hypothetical protein M0805_007135 [Coniferiporia weirii]|nr:hypothetical protein M0805_007135 [Coniferiporia weirii]
MSAPVSATASRLSKKQRKGLAFRQSKGKHRADPEDVPVSEVQDSLDAHDDPVTSRAHVKVKAHKKEAVVSQTPIEQVPSKKRKRTEGDGPAKGAADSDTAERPPKQKKQKRRTEKDAANDENDAQETGAGQDSNAKSQLKTRYILFVGNLKYATTKEAVLAHFAVCDPPPQVRLLTPKSSSASKSKGCAFLEFSHRNALQQALKLHQSELDGRRINVELTAGGGGKSEKRIDKLKERNRGLATQRTKTLQKQNPQDGAAVPERPQRHSTTSGIEDAPSGKRTWTVPGPGDEGTTHRGGQKHVKKRGKSSKKGKEWGTGVNAIPVG